MILVVEDVAETRDGIERLLKVDGYHVAAARDERDAIESARRNAPDLILFGMDGLPRDLVATACRIRDRAELGENVPAVLFCIGEVREGDEIDIGRNLYITCPDNFNQLRSLLIRLLLKVPNPTLTSKRALSPVINQVLLKPARFAKYTETVPLARKGSADRKVHE